MTKFLTALVKSGASEADVAEAKIQSFVIACSDESTALTTGTAKVSFRMPYAFTLTARGAGEYHSGMQLLKKDGKIRVFTETECERLQGFPDGWTEGVPKRQRYKQCGNAVSVPVVRAVMEKLKCYL